jgi:hypothetical protein
MSWYKEQLRQLRIHFAFTFIICAALLVFTATFLRPLMATIAENCRKCSIQVRKPLSLFDPFAMPLFASGWEFQPGQVIEAVETKECAFIFLKRENSSIKPGVANLFVTYYSRPGDKVPHSPDVCYRQGGAIVKSLSKITIQTPQLEPDYSQVDATLIIFRMPKYDQAVIYLFCADGKFCRSRNMVRLIVNTPGNRYLYFSKIEAAASFLHDTDPEPAVELCKQVISQALPVLVKEHFPTVEQLKGP